jgi:hypothetical protein
MDATALLLTTAFHHQISEPNIEAGYVLFVALAGRDIGFDTFCATVAACERDGLIREPIRLPDGALQCHWHLELTPEGVAMASKLRGPGSNKPSTQGA